ncbi:MAG: DUF2914 domain-containing protein [bacterium]
MAVFAGHVKKKDPKWPYIIVITLVILTLWLVISFVSYFSRLAEDQIGKVEVKATTTIAPTREAEVLTLTTSLPEQKERPPENALNASLSVSKISFTSQIADNYLPADEIDSVDPVAQTQVYCYTVVDNPGDKQTIHHVWTNPAGVVVADIPLELLKQPANTWSFVTISGYNPGKWEVQVKTDDGQVIARKSFTTTVN